MMPNKDFLVPNVSTKNPKKKRRLNSNSNANNDNNSGGNLKSVGVQDVGPPNVGGGGSMYAGNPFDDQGGAPPGEMGMIVPGQGVAAGGYGSGGMSPMGSAYGNVVRGPMGIGGMGSGNMNPGVMCPGGPIMGPGGHMIGPHGPVMGGSMGVGSNGPMRPYGPMTHPMDPINAMCGPNTNMGEPATTGPNGNSGMSTMMGPRMGGSMPPCSTPGGTISTGPGSGSPHDSGPGSAGLPDGGTNIPTGPPSNPTPGVSCSLSPVPPPQPGSIPMGPGSGMMGGGAPTPGMSPMGPGTRPLSMSSDKMYPPGQPMVFNPRNPNAPPIYPCGICCKEVRDDDQAILCESGCNFWFHRACTGLQELAFHLLTQEIYAEWVCDRCFSHELSPPVKFKP